jgi:DHA1 family tetracycline resistance protein-like MFS transporter
MQSIQILIGVAFLMHLAGQTHPSIWTLYTQHRFGWNASQVGLSLAAVGFLSALSQGGLTGILVKRFGESRLLVFGILGEAIGFSLFGLVTEGWMVYCVLVFSSIFWSSQPALQSLISREVPPEKQGELQGTLMSLASLTAIINPIMMTTLFSITSDRGAGFYFPGSPYLLAGGLLLLAWFLTLKWWAQTAPSRVQAHTS